MCGYRSYDNAMGALPPLKGTEKGTEGWLPRCPAFGGPREGPSEPCPGEQEDWVVPGRRKSPKASQTAPNQGGRSVRTQGAAEGGGGEEACGPREQSHTPGNGVCVRVAQYQLLTSNKSSHFLSTYCMWGLELTCQLSGSPHNRAPYTSGETEAGEPKET